MPISHSLRTAGLCWLVGMIGVAGCADDPPPTVEAAEAAATESTAASPLTSTVRPATSELVDALAGLGVDIKAMPEEVRALTQFTVFCGAEELGNEPLADPVVRRCFLDAHLAHQSASFVGGYGTVEGDPIVVVWGTDTEGLVNVLTDATRDAFGSGEWELAACVRLTTVSPTPGFECARYGPLRAPTTRNGEAGPPNWFTDRPEFPLCGAILEGEQPAVPVGCFLEALADGDAAAELAIELADAIGARWLRSSVGGQYTVLEVRYGADGPIWTHATCTSQQLSDLLGPLDEGECPPGDSVRFFPEPAPGLPGRYVALGRDGVLRLVLTATGEAEDLYAIDALSRYAELTGLAVGSDGAAAFLAHDPAGNCVGEIVRVPLDGSDAEVVAAGASPVVSPDGRWLAYTIDGFTERGEAPPPISDPDIPCRGRHDSYIWRDLRTGEETRWLAPSPEPGGSNASLALAGFDPASTELAMTTVLIETAVSIVTFAEPDPQASADQREEFANGYLPSAYGWLADGTLLTRLGLPDPETFPPSGLGLTAFDTPTGFSLSPVDVTTPWWLLAGYRDADPRDYGGFSGTWAWDQSGEPIQLAENAMLAWVPEP